MNRLKKHMKSENENIVRTIFCHIIYSIEFFLVFCHTDDLSESDEPKAIVRIE